MAYFTNVANQLGVSLWLLIVILVWTLAWKLTGLWRAARKGHFVWFIVIAFLNTVGILPILYIYVFSNMKFVKNVLKKKPAKKSIKKKRK